jgi:A/G-specific adenine glycosylase
LQWYAAFGRAALPWRRTRDPYAILVSEVMLQQTQVERVVPKFEAFVERFPTFAELAKSTTADVLRFWKGLGYNSRAVRLKRLAEEVCERFGGALPHDVASLRSLPGMGPYTIAAVRAFAFELDDAAIDTNVRRVVHRLFFGLEHPPAVPPATIDAKAREIVPHGCGHDWNSAMMDLGATICTARAPKCLLCPMSPECAAAPIDAAGLEEARRAHAVRKTPQEQIPFERSNRFLRGRIIDRLRDLPDGETISLLDLHRELQPLVPGRSVEEMDEAVGGLERDGMLKRERHRIALSDR